MRVFTPFIFDETQLYQRRALGHGTQSLLYALPIHAQHTESRWLRRARAAENRRIGILCVADRPGSVKPQGVGQGYAIETCTVSRVNPVRPANLLLVTSYLAYRLLRGKYTVSPVRGIPSRFKTFESRFQHGKE